MVDRLAVIDVGSNSVRLVVFDGAHRSPHYFFNEKVLCGLGQGLTHTGMLNPEGRLRAIAALRRFCAVLEHINLKAVVAVATEAVRRADDGAAFCAEVKSELGIDLQVITGEQEARLSAQGVLLGRPQTTGLVCDIGGSSMELAQITAGQIGLVRSSKLGPLSVMDYAQDIKTRHDYIQSAFGCLAKGFEVAPHKLYLVGGSWRVVAQLLMQCYNYPLHIVHEYEASRTQILESLDWLDMQSKDNTQSVIPERRRVLLPAAIMVLREMLEHIHPKRILFSSYGLREGLLFEQMTPAVRGLDPLLETAKAQEQKHARFVGFGESLFDWLRPLFGDIDEKRTRLIRVSCLLHDVHWRSHPDYRADVAFGAVTRGNLGALGHKGRAYIAWCLLHRYKNRTQSDVYKQIQGLLSDKDCEQAVVVGQAIRLGAMLATGNAAHLGQLAYRDNKVILRLPARCCDVIGEAVHKRLQDVAERLNAEKVIEFYERGKSQQ